MGIIPVVHAFRDLPTALAPTLPPGLASTLAAGLARRSVAVVDGFLGRDVAAQAAREAYILDENGGLTAAGVSRNGVDGEAIRDDRTAWVNPDPVLQPGMTAAQVQFTALLSMLRDELWIGVEGFDLQLACYPGDGARYVRHRDAFRVTAPGSRRRRMTAVLYLNPTWCETDGGVLRVYPSGQSHLDVEPLLDRLVVFASDVLWHEVRPTAAQRLALTAWYWSVA